MRMILITAAVIALSGCSFQSSIGNPPPPSRNVTMRYTATEGLNAATGRASRWCNERYGSSSVRLLNDDRSAGRATFACGPA